MGTNVGTTHGGKRAADATSAGAAPRPRAGSSSRRRLPGRVDKLTDAVARLAAADSLERVTAIVTGAVRELLGADGATFVLREEGVCFYVDEDAISPLWKGQRFPAYQCLSGWVMAHGRMAVVPDIYADARIPHDAYRPTFVQALALAPVRSEDPVAAIGAYWSTNYEPSPREQAVLAALADAAAAALANLELRAQLQLQTTTLAEVTSDRESVETAMHSLVHDLRSPMFALDAYATLLASGNIGAEEIATIAEKMHASVEGMGTRMDRLLALYRLDHQPITPHDLDLSALAAEVARHVRYRTGAYDVALWIEPGLRVRMDPVLAQLMMENLLENAYKYTAPTEEPRVQVRRAADAPVAPASGMVWVSVQDNGIGFDPAGAGDLFAARVRLQTAASFTGTGLGLASVARIVELHGGEIRAHGVPGQGATFSLCLPTPGAPPQAGDAAGDGPDVRGHDGG